MDKDKASQRQNSYVLFLWLTLLIHAFYVYQGFALAFTRVQQVLLSYGLSRWWAWAVCNSRVQWWLLHCHYLPLCCNLAMLTTQTQHMLLSLVNLTRLSETIAIKWPIAFSCMCSGWTLPIQSAVYISLFIPRWFTAGFFDICATVRCMFDLMVKYISWSFLPVGFLSVKLSQWCHS